jgi:hypothetical protein
LCTAVTLTSLKTSPASRRVAHVLKLQRRMTAGPREALARAAPAPDLYNPQARASVGADDLVIDAVGTLRGAWRRPSAAGLGAPVVGTGASEHHLAFPPRVQWFSQCPPVTIRRKGVGEYVPALTRALPWAGVWPLVRLQPNSWFRTFLLTKKIINPPNPDPKPAA